MTEIITATADFNIDFEFSFLDNIEVASGVRWDAISQKHIDTGINFDLIKYAKLVIFTGGEDIYPGIYGQENTYSYFNFERDIAEIVILEYALSLNKKILGICRGHQLINAYLGGDLAQDLRVCLKQDHEHYHDLDILEKGGKITDIFTKVNSIHHQGVTKAGNGLVATSFYKGVIESCESDSIITTQFHPEFMGGEEVDNFFEYIKSWANLGDQ
jgi:putative glutamine amidotransferase